LAQWRRQVDWCSDAVFRQATSGGAGGVMELDDELSEFITSLTGSCEEVAAADDGGGALAAALATAAALGGAAHLDSRPPSRAGDSPPSVGAQPRLSFPSADVLEALQAAAPPPRAATDRGCGVAAAAGAPPRLRRSHTFTSALAPPPEPHPPPMSARKRPVAHLEEEAAAAVTIVRQQQQQQAAMRHHMQQRSSASSFLEMMSSDDLPLVRQAGVRRSASMPMAFTQPGSRGAAAQISDLLHGGGGNAAASAAVAARDADAFFAAAAGGSSASYGLIPEWAREGEGAGSAPQLTAAGLPAFPVPGAPPPGAPRTSGYRGVSRAPWSTRWDAHVPASAPASSASAPAHAAKTHFCGSFDAEERAARAYDLALLKLHGAAAAAPLCNFGLGEYPGWEDLAAVPDGEFIDAIVASAYEPTERRYSKYRGVFRPRGAPKGAPVQWEGRLEEAPASVACTAAPGTFSN
jgi:hypothetical protein